jgi:hypothetical protein
MSPFDVLNSINSSKENLIESGDLEESAYPAFIVRRGLSLYIDSIIYANAMNISHELDHKLQYEYLLNSVRKRKRFSKWPKKLESPDIDLIKRDLNYSTKRALEVEKLLTEETIDRLKEVYSNE